MQNRLGITLISANVILTTARLIDPLYLLILMNGGALVTYTALNGLNQTFEDITALPQRGYAASQGLFRRCFNPGSENEGVEHTAEQKVTAKLQ